MPTIVIVGAGISGLSLAYRLQHRLPATEITILEQHNRPGGTIWTERREGFQVEIGPNGFLDSKPSTVTLCQDLGLGDRLLSASEVSAHNRYLFDNGKLCLLPTSLLAFCRSNLLSWRGKLEFLLERFRRRGSEDAHESVDQFVRRRAGREAAEVLADAMVTGIYAGDPGHLGVRAAFPRLAQLEKDFGSVLKGLARSARQRRDQASAQGKPYQRGSKLHSFRAGMRLLVETLAGRLSHPPLLSVAVRQIERVPRASGGFSWIVRGDGRGSWPADVVVLTCPAYEQARILYRLDEELAQRIKSIPYNRLAVVALGYRAADLPRPLDGFGFITPQRLGRDLLGVQWCSSIFPERAPPGLVSMRAMCGGWKRPEIVDWDDERLLQAVRAELALVMGIQAAPAFHHIVRWTHAIPQYRVSHVEDVEWINERSRCYGGLFLGGNAYHGVALNDCTEQAETLADRVQRYVESLPAARSGI
jgi:oxygen-dependent protoporphyrinogen oxidase